MLTPTDVSGGVIASLSFARTHAMVGQPVPLDPLTCVARPWRATCGRLKGALTGDGARRARDPRRLGVA